ncbi:MAG TPA: DUF6265 family protein [Phycisphaerales bacterium]
MRTRNGVVLAAAVGLVLVMAGLGEPTAAPGSTPASGASTAHTPAKIADAAFLAGRWQGTMGAKKDNHVEEIWTEPVGNNIAGVFRWVKADGSPSVFELLTIQEEEGTLALRLRHQTATGATWEGKDSTVTMRLSEKGPALAVFSAFKDCGDLAACRYEVKDQRLHIEVRFAEPSSEEAAKGKKARPTLRFEMERRPL